MNLHAAVTVGLVAMYMAIMIVMSKMRLPIVRYLIVLYGAIRSVQGVYAQI